MFKRCTGCGAKIPERRCPKCEGKRFTWAFVVDVSPPGGKRKQIKRGGFATKAEALAAMGELQGDLADGIHVERRKITTGQYLTRWLEAQKAQLKPSTHDRYERAWTDYLESRIGEVRLQSLDGPTLTATYGALIEGGGRAGAPLALATVRYSHAVLRKALNDAVRQGVLARNPALLADLPRQVRRDDPLTTPEEADERLQVWTAEQVRAFVEHRKAAHDPHWPLWVVAVGTGMRRGEVLGLRWSDVDLDQAALRVRQTVVTISGKVRLETPKTAKSRRTISVDPVVVDALRAQRRAQAESGRLHALVFARDDGRPWDPNLVSTRFRAAITDVNACAQDTDGRTVRGAEEPTLARIRFHDLRHTYATLALAAGVPLHVVSKRLGHATIAITHDVYSHWMPQTDEQAAAMFAAHVWTAPDIRDHSVTQ